jgi:hypothetical protein
MFTWEYELNAFILKGKFFLSTLCRHTGGVKVELHSFLTLVKDGVEWSTSGPDCFAPGNETQHPQKRTLLGPQSRSGRIGEKKNFLPRLGFELQNFISWSEGRCWRWNETDGSKHNKVNCISTIHERGWKMTECIDSACKMRNDATWTNCYPCFTKQITSKRCYLD